MSNAEYQETYRNRQLKEGRKKRTTSPLNLIEWDKVKSFIKKLTKRRIQ